MTGQPLVSVLMSCYNGERFIKSSVNSLIKQTYQNWELIFWDNYSTDNSEQIINSIKDDRIKYFKSEKNTEIGIAKQSAFNKASGEYIAFLDVDDMWLKKKLEHQINILKVYPDYSAIYSRYLILDERKDKKRYSKHNHEQYKSGYIFDDVLKSYSMGNPLVNNLTALFNKEDLLKLNYIFDRKLHIAADFDLIVRFSKNKKFFFLDKYLSVYRLHAKNETYKSKSQQIKELDHWVKKNIDTNYLKNNKHYYSIKNNVFYEKLKIKAYEGEFLSVFCNLNKINSFLKIITILIFLILPKKIINIMNII